MLLLKGRRVDSMKNKSIKYSIVVPMYNVEKYIEKCILSIINQTYNNFELLIVNDGSTDSSADIINNIKDKRIKVLNKKNGGLSDARNYGVKYSTGDYIWFVDGDDYIKEDSLEIINKKLSNEKCDLLIFKYYRVKDNKEFKNKELYYGFHDKRKILLCSKSPIACAKIFSREFYLKNKFEFKKGVYYEDLEIVPYIMSLTDKICYIDDYLYYYVIRNNSIMNNNIFNIKKDDKFYVIDSLFSRFKNNNTYEKYKDELEYLALFHFISVTLGEILVFNRKIYLPRCNRIISALNDINIEWYKNKYLKEASLVSRTFAWLFRKRLFRICAFLVRVKMMI